MNSSGRSALFVSCFSVVLHNWNQAGFQIVHEDDTLLFPPFSWGGGGGVEEGAGVGGAGVGGGRLRSFTMEVG